MTTTSITLLNRLQQSDDPQNWDRLFQLYAPLLAAWLRKYDVQPADADDLVQEVLVVVARDLAKFDHNGRPGAFRTWLRGILVHRLKNFWRAKGRLPKSGSDMQQRLAQLEDPVSAISQFWNQQHDRHVASRLMASAESGFKPVTWTAFTRVAIDGEPADVVADDLGITTNAVFIAKSRVLSRLRQDALGLIAASSDFSPPS